MDTILDIKKSVALATELSKAGAEGGSRTHMPEGARF